MRSVKKILCILITLILVSDCFYVTASISEDSEQTGMSTTTEEKIFSTATMDEEFADNKVIVVFNKEESNKLRDYRVEDFSELSVTKVIDLTQNTKAILQAVRYDTESSNLQAASLETRQFISENYNQIITLELKTPG